MRYSDPHARGRALRRGDFFGEYIEEEACVVNNGGGGEEGTNESKKTKLVFYYKAEFLFGLIR